MKRATLSILALCVLLVACGSRNQSEFDGGSDRQLVAVEPGAPATTAPSSEEGGDQSSVGGPVVDNRQVIYDGSIHLQAADTRNTFDRIVLLVETSGGFLAASQVSEAPEEEQPMNSPPPWPEFATSPIVC
jgi:hypothetical protein